MYDRSISSRDGRCSDIFRRPPLALALAFAVRGAALDIADGAVQGAGIYKNLAPTIYHSETLVINNAPRTTRVGDEQISAEGASYTAPYHESRAQTIKRGALPLLESHFGLTCSVCRPW